MAPRFKITDEVRDVLARSTIDATSLRLPEQLARDLYVKVDKVLKAAGGKWNRKGGVHLFDRDPREVLGLAIESGEATNVKQALQAFYTPAPLARRVVELAEIEPGNLVLEPSAGMGALCEAANAACPRATIVACDLDPVAVDQLRHRWEPLVGSTMEPLDFLKVEPVPIYDRVVMNPPFTGSQDMAHVTHAFRFLSPGGRLVAITSPSWCTAQTGAAEAFRTLVEENQGTTYELPPGAFKEAGTNVATAILVLEKAVVRIAPSEPRQLSLGLEAA